MPVTLVNCDNTTHYVYPVYADANFICYSRDRHSLKYPSSRIILANLIIQQVPIFISDLVVDEVWWAFIRGWYRKTTGNNLHSHMVKDDPSILARFYVLIERNTRKIFNIPRLMMVPQEIPGDITNMALNIFRTENLMPRDCFHLAYAITHEMQGFITSDQDFDNLLLPDYHITLYKF